MSTGRSLKNPAMPAPPKAASVAAAAQRTTQLAQVWDKSSLPEPLGGFWLLFRAATPASTPAYGCGKKQPRLSFEFSTEILICFGLLYR